MTRILGLCCVPSINIQQRGWYAAQITFWRTITFEPGKLHSVLTALALCHRGGDLVAPGVFVFWLEPVCHLILFLRAVFEALHWLKTNNPKYYGHIEIDRSRLEQLPEDDVPMEVLGVVRQSTDTGLVDQESNGYAPADDVNETGM
jgi:hypothetical protein